MKRFTDAFLLIGPSVIILSLFSFNEYIISLLSYVITIICISICKCSKKHESLFLFVFIPVITIPANLRIINSVSEFIENLFQDNSYLIFLFIPVLYGVLLSCEELIMGIIGRVIWHQKQYSFYE